MAEKEEVKTNRDRYIERLKGKYPDKEFLDDEAIFGQTSDDFDALDAQVAQYKEREDKLVGLFNSSPRGASLFQGWMNGEDPVIQLVRKFGPELKEALNDPEKQEALAAANQEFADKVAKEEEYEKIYQGNLTATAAELDAMQAEEGLTDDQINSALAFLINIVNDGFMGKFTRESVHMALKALNHDEDVAVAEETGEVRGRNTRIEEKLRREKQGDGAANLSGKNGGSMPRRTQNSIFDIAAGAR